MKDILKAFGLIVAIPFIFIAGACLVLASMLGVELRSKKDGVDYFV